MIRVMREKLKMCMAFENKDSNIPEENSAMEMKKSPWCGYTLENDYIFSVNLITFKYSTYFQHHFIPFKLQFLSLYHHVMHIHIIHRHMLSQHSMGADCIF